MNNIIYSEDIVKAINTFLTEDNWNFYFDEKHGVFQFGLRIKSKIKKVNYRIYVAENDYIVYAISPLGVDEDDERMLAAMAEFICRANYGLVNGNFELDMSDGEIRFKCFVDCDNITPSTEVIRNSIHCPAAMFKQYGSGIVDSIFGNASAKEVVANCEGTPLEELHTIGGDDDDDPDDPDEPASGLNYRYRSISVDDPFPRGESYIPYNWKKWYSIGNNQTRLSNSLNYTPVYTVTFNRGNSDQITGEDSTYVNWSNINNDGSSKLLNSWKTSGILNSNSVQSYCEKGRFSTECDSNTGGG